MRLRPFIKDDEDVARKLTVQPDLFLVGEESGAVVATLMAGYGGHRGWVNYLAVSPGHRRLGCPKLNVQGRSANAEALDFYRALGYLRDETVSLGKRLIPDEPTAK